MSSSKKASSWSPGFFMLIIFIAASFDYHGQGTAERNNWAELSKQDIVVLEDLSWTKFNFFKYLKSQWFKKKYKVQ